MVNKKFVDYIGNKLDIGSTDLIEKDILLQMLLIEFNKNILKVSENF